MELFADLAPITLAASLACLIVTIGLDASPHELLHLLRRPWVLARAVLAVNLVVPAVAVVAVTLTPISPAAKAGVLLMAIAPAPPLTAFRQIHVGADRAYAYSLYLALIVLAVPLVPIAMALLARFDALQAEASVARIALFVALTALAPLAVGIWLRRSAPGLVPRLDEWIGNVAVLGLVAAFFPFPLLLLPTLDKMIGDGTLLVMALVSAAGLAAGHLLGGPEPAARRALAVTAANRHPGIALLIATANGGDPSVAAAILGFFIIGMMTSGLYEHWTPLGAPVRRT
jgi:bile acid:Na+ symporter, BASS family